MIIIFRRIALHCNVSYHTLQHWIYFILYFEKIRLSTGATIKWFRYVSPWYFSRSWSIHWITFWHKIIWISVPYEHLKLFKLYMYVCEIKSNCKFFIKSSWNNSEIVMHLRMQKSLPTDFGTHARTEKHEIEKWNSNNRQIFHRWLTILER